MKVLFDILMLPTQHPDVRTTLTLDDDVAAKLKAEARHSGEPFEPVVNRLLCAGLHSQTQAAEPADLSLSAFSRLLSPLL